MESLMLVDTTEVLRPWPRKLHAALAEIAGRKVLVPPTVATELAPLVAPEGLNVRTSEAEQLLKANPQLGKSRRREVEQQAWWASVWRDDKSPYGIIQLTEEQRELTNQLRKSLPVTGFRNAKAGYVADHRDARIVAESMAVGAKVLLTSNLRSIEHDAVNAWAVANGPRFGLRAEAVVHEADGVLTAQAQGRDGRDRLVQAGLMACWPLDDRTAADAIIDAATSRIRKASQQSGRLPETGAVLVDALQDKDRARELVERVRQGLPSAAITTDREHPSFPEAPAAAPTPALGTAASRAGRVDDDIRSR